MPDTPQWLAEIRALLSALATVGMEQRDAARAQASALSKLAVALQGIETRLAAREKNVDGATETIEEIRRAIDELRITLRATSASSEERGKRVDRLVDRFTRLTLVQAVALIFAGLSIPITVAGLVLAITDPSAVLSTLVVVVDALPGVEVDPDHMPATGADHDPR